jgi:hypothetical protein
MMMLRLLPDVFLLWLTVATELLWVTDGVSTGDGSSTTVSSDGSRKLLPESVAVTVWLAARLADAGTELLAAGELGTSVFDGLGVTVFDGAADVGAADVGAADVRVAVGVGDFVALGVLVGVGAELVGAGAVVLGGGVLDGVLGGGVEDGGGALVDGSTDGAGELDGGGLACAKAGAAVSTTTTVTAAAPHQEANVRRTDPPNGDND